MGMVGGGGDADAKEVLSLSLENLLLSEGNIGQVWITHPPAEKQERCLVKEGVKGLPFWVHSMFSPFPDHVMLTHRSVYSVPL